MRKLLVSLVVLFAFLALPSSAQADTLVLTNGSKIEGRIVKETGTEVVIDVPGVGKLNVERRRIKEIRRGGTPPSTKPPSSSSPRTPRRTPRRSPG
ncbi:MAG: hypothetical protein ACYTDY_13740 [Planctomycetota bacterium]|jgi:hypothetical protein